MPTTNPYRKLAAKLRPLRNLSDSLLGLRFVGDRYRAVRRQALGASAFSSAPAPTPADGEPCCFGKWRGKFNERPAAGRARWAPLVYDIAAAGPVGKLRRAKP
jgi:hypothetical protein